MEGMNNLHEEESEKHNWTISLHQVCLLDGRTCYQVLFVPTPNELICKLLGFLIATQIAQNLNIIIKY